MKKAKLRRALAEFVAAYLDDVGGGRPTLPVETIAAGITDAMLLSFKGDATPTTEGPAHLGPDYRVVDLPTDEDIGADLDIIRHDIPKRDGWELLGFILLQGRWVEYLKRAPDGS